MRREHEATPANARFALAAAGLAQARYSLFLGLLFVGCSGGDDATLTLPSDSPAGSDQPADPDASDLGPAVLVTGLVPGVDSALLYVGALPELPTGELSYSRFREFSIQDGYVYTNAGHVYVWEGQAREMTRFSVNEAYELVEGPRVSFANRLPGSSNHVFISPTRAYFAVIGPGRGAGVGPGGDGHHGFNPHEPARAPDDDGVLCLLQARHRRR